MAGLTLLLIQSLSAFALVTEGMEHGGGLPAKEANVLTKRAGVEPLAGDPAAPFEVHESESTMFLTALLPLPSTCT